MTVRNTAPHILIFRNHLLPASETFIREQGEALGGLHAYYLGSRKCEGGLETPPDRTLLVRKKDRRGLLEEVYFKVTGRLPGRMRREVEAIDPALLHAHFGFDAARILPSVRMIDVPFLVTFHGYDATMDMREAAWSWKTAQYRWRRKAVFEEADSILAVSRFIKSKVIQQGAPPEKVTVHYIGIDAEFFRPSRGVDREPVVVFVGRLVEKKGCEYLIRAMAEVQKAVPGARLVVIGDGELKDSLERLGDRLLGQQVRFLGTLPPENVRRWLNRCRVLCVPSVTAASGDAEGLGMVFLEAQAMETPVVSSDSGGIPEAVEHGETGFLAEERDVEKLTEYLALLLKDDALWSRMSEAGRRRVLERFDIRAQSRKLEDHYISLMA